MAVVDGGGSNVLAFFTGDGFVLVDSGAPKSCDTIMASLGVERQGQHALQYPLSRRSDRQQ